MIPHTASGSILLLPSFLQQIKAQETNRSAGILDRSRSVIPTLARPALTCFVDTTRVVVLAPPNRDLPGTATYSYVFAPHPLTNPLPKDHSQI